VSRRVPLAVAVALALSCPVTASAYRPFNSTDAAVAAKGEVELELGPIGYVAQGADRALVAPSVVLNWGFADGWEAVLEGRHLVWLDSDKPAQRPRVEDAALSLKSVLREGSLQEKTGVSVATELSALLPDVDGDSGAGAELTLIASQRWRDLTVHLNGAVAWTRAHEPGAFAGIILEGHDAWPVRPVAEVFVEGERGSATTVSGLVGTIWRVSEGLSLDAGVRRARAGSVDTTEVRVGLTWGFRVGFPR
jgi:hypothetical protein